MGRSLQRAGSKSLSAFLSFLLVVWLAVPAPGIALADEESGEDITTEVLDDSYTIDELDSDYVDEGVDAPADADADANVTEDASTDEFVEVSEPDEDVVEDDEVFDELVELDEEDELDEPETSEVEDISEELESAEDGAELEDETLALSSVDDNDVVVDAKEDTDAKKDESSDDEKTVTPSIQYRALTGSGWQDGYVVNGKTAGAASSSKMIAGLKIKLSGLGTSYAGSGVRYRALVQDKGWQSWVSTNALAGSSKKTVRLEALKVELTGKIKKDYSVMYRVYTQKGSWLGWTKDGAAAGTGKSLRVAGVQIKLVKKSAAKVSGKAFLAGSGLRVSAHMQKYGWKTAVASGKVAGNAGKGLRLEALKVSLSGLEVGGGVSTSAYVQGKGWRNWVGNGKVAGTTGKSLRLEGVRIKLTGEASKAYDLYYRTYIGGIGWLGWAKNGQKSGTSLSSRVEAVQVRLVKKGAQQPTSKPAVNSPYITSVGLRYQAKVQGGSWQGVVKSGAVSGTTGKSKRIEGLRVKLTSTKTGSIKYKAYVKGKGWESYTSNFATAGTTWGSKVIEGIKVSLKGDISKFYDVYYRVHISTAGWLGWAKNGETAGDPSVGKQIEAYQVKLVPKGGKAPGSREYHVIGKSYFSDAMIRKAQGYSSPTGWLILVDCTKNRIGFFRGARGSWLRTKTFRVSTGKASTPTVKGVYSVGARGYSFGVGTGHTCYYWTQFYRDFLFHSILYHEGTHNVLDGRMGMNISGGCVRMPIDEAKWVYDTIPSGTTVVTY